MPYLLDANVFMSAKNLHYGFDFCPAFWQWLINENGKQKVFSIEKVGDEINAGEDELSKWVKFQGEKFFKKPDQTLLLALGKVSESVNTAHYEQSAKSIFFQGADYYLVAQACADGHTVVTHEVASASMKRVKIPDVCLGLGVKFVTPYQMLRQEKAHFVLKGSTKRV